MYKTSASELRGDGYKMSCNFAALKSLFMFNFTVTQHTKLKFTSQFTSATALPRGKKTTPASVTGTPYTLTLLCLLVNTGFFINYKSSV